MSEVLEGRAKFRQLRGPLGRIETILLVAIVATGSSYMIGVHEYVGLMFFKEQYLGLFLGLSLAAIFLITPHSKSCPLGGPPWFDCLLAGMGLLVGLYVAIMYPRILEHLGVITPERSLLGGITVLLILEAIRRLIGWTLVAVVATFVLYTRFSHLAPGPLQAPSVSWERLAAYLYLDTNALLGLVFGVGATVVFSYILFGNLLFGCGGGKTLTDLALATTGRFTGGPAKMAVVASAFFGTLSGSSVANVVLTGSVTIPMMKKIGYRGDVAAAIEAAASTGGIIAPPVMGAVAFVMAEVLSISYAEVALAALLPAVLYFSCVLLQVHMHAARQNLRGLPASAVPSVLAVISTGWWIVIPLSVLLYLLFVIRVDPGRAAMGATLTVLAVGLMTRQGRQYIIHSRAWIKTTGRAVMELAAILAGAALVVGTANLSGLAVLLPWQLVDLSGGNVLVLLMLVAIVGIVLGMGLPAVPVYLLLAVLCGPALISGGILPLAAHMFILYFGILSMVTPPNCITAFTAASLAGSPPMRTGILSAQMSIAAYVVPWIFVHNPSLLLLGTPVAIALAFAGTIVGIGYIICGIAGYTLERLGWLSRVVLTLCGIAILYPTALGARAEAFGMWLGSSALLVGLSTLILPSVIRRLRFTAPQDS